MLAVDPRKLDEIPESIVEMMGYNTHRPFIGYGEFFGTKSVVLSYDKLMEGFQNDVMGSESRRSGPADVCNAVGE